MGASADPDQSSETSEPQDSSTWLPDLDALNKSVPSNPGPAGAAEAGSSIRGKEVSGTDYSWTAPPGWTDISADLAREDMAADTAMAGPEVDGVRENLTVTVLEDKTLNAYENNAHADLGYLSDDIVIGDRVRIDALTAAHARAEANTGRADFIFDQYAVLHDGTMYALSFTISAERSLSERQGLITQVLASWQWNTADVQGDR